MLNKMASALSGGSSNNNGNHNGGSNSSMTMTGGRGGEIGREADESSGESSQIMMERVKVGMVVDMADAKWVGGLLPVIETPRFPYARPDFMYLNEDNLMVAGDQTTRPVLVPKDPSNMPLYAGYAETINAGKTKVNEDQAAAKILHLVEQSYGYSQPSNSKIQTTNTPVPGRKNLEATTKEVKIEDDGTDDFDEDDDETGDEAAAATRNNDSLAVPDNDDPILLPVTPTTSKAEKEEESVIVRTDAYYFGIFDGHAGSGAALMASNCLHEHIRERLSQVLGTIVHLDRQEESLGYQCGSSSKSHPITTPNGKSVTRDSLVIGALETAFVEMDDQISEEKLLWRIPGGSASIVSLFLLGKLYVANAGDCRALLVHHQAIAPLSTDFTPDAERKRLQLLAFRQPELLGRQFTRLEYNRHLTRKDLKRKVLYRDWYMDGWALKTVRDADLRSPLISDGFRKVRLLNTIGVTRGLGDHHLMTLDDRIPIKPFLSPVPQVEVFDMSSVDAINDRDVLVMGSDGLWDVLTNEDVAEIVQAALSQSEEFDTTMYTLAAQDLVIAARGDPGGANGCRWELSGGRHGHASMDDITVFVIPLKHALAPPPQDDDDAPLPLD